MTRCYLEWSEPSSWLLTTVLTVHIMNAPSGADHLVFAPSIFYLFTDWSCSMQIGYMNDRIFITETAKIKTTPGVLIPQREMWSFLQMFKSSSKLEKFQLVCQEHNVFAFFQLKTWKCSTMSLSLISHRPGVFLSPLSPATWIIFFKHGCHHLLISFAVSRPSSTLLFHFIVCVYL